MTEETPPIRPIRISNEVLEERLTQYFTRTTEAFEAINTKLDKLDGRLERDETNQVILSDRMRDHEHLLHHPETSRKISTIETTLASMQSEITKLNQISEIERSVSGLSAKVELLVTDVDKLKDEHLFKDGEQKGRGQVFSAFEKSFLKLVLGASLISTFISILINTGILG